MTASYTCPDCGTPYKAGDKFCKECGLRLINTPLGETGTRRLPDQVPLSQGRRVREAPSKTSTGPIIPISLLGSGLLLLMFLCIGLVMLFKPQVGITITPTPMIVTATITPAPELINTTVPPTDTVIPPPTTLVPPTPTDVPIPLTATSVPPTPTEVLLPPSATPIPPPPTETPVTDTPPDTILEVGQTWEEDGLHLTLTDAEITLEAGGGAYINLVLVNKRPESMILIYSGSNFSASTNLGQAADVGYWGTYLHLPDDWRHIGEQKLVFPSEAKQEIRDILVRFDVANPNVKEAILTVDGISSIHNARWRIPNLGQ